MTTPSRFTGSGPKKAVKAPGWPRVGGGVARELGQLVNGVHKPALAERTAAMTMTIPKSMIIPWIKSLMAVAMYPPRMT